MLERVVCTNFCGGNDFAADHDAGCSSNSSSDTGAETCQIMSHSPTLVRAGTMRKSINGSARICLGVVVLSGLTGWDDLTLGPGFFDVIGYLIRVQQLIEFLDSLV